MAENERIPTVDPEQVAALERAADAGPAGADPRSRAARDPHERSLLGSDSELHEKLDRLERMLRHTMYLVSVLAKIARVQPEELQAAHEVALQAERGTKEADDATG